LKDKKVEELEKYEKEYLSRLNDKKKTKSVAQKKPVVKKPVVKKPAVKKPAVKKPAVKKPEVKKPKKKVSKKSVGTKTKKTRKTPKNAKIYEDDDTGIVLIEDNLEVDEQMELEERKAYLEEARSQDSSD